ncbi:MFS transporter, YNFM family, putative membrane transport protein [Azotobacter beijerinckii]|uniref:MFS transporter, YNFM family, putative membrane transport protein n=2 Tax=Azotobacter beijerinckii TaxID=170623 RepID=A0A1I3YCB3_9GAMM|nr:MFS transporter, YNFM family, putative membrane transport protein [Azotobacter beijerinckii]SFK29452.1 MFS transporter, YNFM family, putative membrane transport protein [Azotobacter beijerinckii]
MLADIPPDNRPAIAPAEVEMNTLVAHPAPAAPLTEKGTAQFRRTNWALFAGGFATFALLYCVQPMLPVFSTAFALSAAQSSLALSISTMTLAVGLLLTGPLSDALGRKPVMVAALCAAALCTLLTPLMPSWHALLLMRALIGLALSGLVAVAMSYLSEEVDPRHLGLAMGLYISGNSLGGMGGRLISGVLVDFVSWQAAVAVLGGLALLAALVFWRLLPDSRHFRPTPLSLANLAGGLRLHLSDRGLPWLFLEAFLVMGSFVALFNYIGYRLLEPPYDLSMSLVGTLSVVYLSGTYSSTQAGALADRLGRHRVFWPAILLMLAGLLLTLFSALGLILAGMLLFAFGFFAAHSLASSWVGRRALQARGQASSLYLFSYYVGSSVAGTAGGFFWQHGGWNGVGLFIAALLALALGVALHLSRLPPKQPAA